MSATVTGTVLTVVGWKNRPLAANATTTSAAAATAATNANLSGRFAGPMSGSRKPNAGFDFGSLITCSKARPTSTRASGTASSVAIECASSETYSKRVLHSAQPSRWAASSPARASGSSTIRRSFPSVRCATGDLLAQSCFRASQQSSNLSDADAQRLGDLRVTEPAGSHRECGRGFGGQPAECHAHLPPILIDLDLLLRVEGSLSFFEGLGHLSLLPAPRAAQPIERRVRRGSVQPRRRVLSRRRMQPVEVDEDFLRDVLRLVRIGEDAVGYPDDACVFGCEKVLERLVVRPDDRHAARSEVHAHYS